ncbi:hypothetical protein D5S17_29970 [Pseudonocardiaceae bacterium YIM PH 21723]|nr:hypothetical protein D5S17_29970 [Pseudonocardiaceae bacterium YIM PH 21723]
MKFTKAQYVTAGLVLVAGLFVLFGGLWLFSGPSDIASAKAVLPPANEVNAGVYGAPGQPGDPGAQDGSKKSIGRPGVDGSTSTGAGNAAKPAVGKTATPRTVTFSVTGSGTASISSDVQGYGLVREEQAVALPWNNTSTWPGDQPVQVAQVLVHGDKNQPVTCSISVDGKEVEKHSSTPDKPVATCRVNLIGA